MARTFDGVDDQVAFGSESAIDNLSTFTAVAYIRPTANITDERQILVKMDSGFVGNMYITALGSGGNNNKISAYRVATGNDPYSETVADILVPNTWKIILVYFDSANFFQSQKIFHSTVGGVMTEASYAVGGTSGTWSGTLEADASATLRVGSRDSADATYFAGGIAECALWNRILTAGEIKAIGQGFSPLFFPNGRVFYSPINGRNNPERNYSGAGSSGTVTGTTFLDHPPVIYPNSVSFGLDHGVVAPASGQPYAKRTAGVPYMNRSSFSPKVW